jgi:hypothetical protein
MDRLTVAKSQPFADSNPYTRSLFKMHASAVANASGALFVRGRHSATPYPNTSGSKWTLLDNTIADLV